MRCSRVMCSNDAIGRTIPQRGKVPEYSVKPPRSEHWAVLHEREPGLYLANDPGHFGPQSASFSVKSVSLSGNADVLTRKPSADDVNVSPPRSTVEGCNVIENWEPRKHTVRLPLGKDLLAIVIDLDGAHGLVSE